MFRENLHAASRVNLVKELPVNRDLFDVIGDGTPLSHFRWELQGYSLYPLDAESDP